MRPCSRAGMGRTTSHTGTSLLDFCTTSACLRATCTWLFPVPRDQYMSRLVPTCQALQPFSLEPFLPCSPRPPALPILTVPALAPLVPPDKDVAKKHQDQQAQPDTQDSPEHVDGLLSCKAEGEEALQTQEAGRSDHARRGERRAVGLAYSPPAPDGPGLWRDCAQRGCCASGHNFCCLQSWRFVVLPQPLLSPGLLVSGTETGARHQKGVWATPCPWLKQEPTFPISRIPCSCARWELVRPQAAFSHAQHPSHCCCPPWWCLYPHSWSHAHSSGAKHLSGLHRTQQGLAMQFSCSFGSRSAGREGGQQSRAGAEETLAAVAHSWHVL